MNYYGERILWKLCLTAATMPSEIILTIASYVIASVLAVQMVRVSSEHQRSQHRNIPLLLWLEVRCFLVYGMLTAGQLVCPIQYQVHGVACS